jgi:hypothetical protein
MYFEFLKECFEEIPEYVPKWKMSVSPNIELFAHASIKHELLKKLENNKDISVFWIDLENQTKCEKDLQMSECYFLEGFELSALPSSYIGQLSMIYPDINILKNELDLKKHFSKKMRKELQNSMFMQICYLKPDPDEFIDLLASL